ncbi:TolC family protein [Ideonella sp. DXS22W]|uniref:TolC family protein n=1 Tax=Pseudaquabacterium inlustre TaxID=2984192 RepID=A0ABU9CDE1_9BURK
MPRTRRLLVARPRQAVTALAASLALAAPALHAACVDESRVEPQAPLAGGTQAHSDAATAPASGTAAQPTDARQQLGELVRDAIAQSNGINAARTLVDAALQDLEEARAGKLPQAALTGSMSPSLVDTGALRGSQVQASAGITLSQMLWDGGRADRVIDWRRQLTEVARLGHLSTQEQITLSTVSLAFERSRYRMTAAIYGQNARKMGCLVEALETIVAADRGRQSELVQARKQLMQAELQQAQSVSQARQVEAKLRRVVGAGLPSIDGLSTVLLAVPDLADVLTAAEGSVEIEQLGANAAAMREMARAVEAGTRPQVGWNVNGSAAVAGGSAVGTSGRHNGTLSAGVTLSVPLINKAVDHSVAAARKRAEAASLQRADALEQRRQRITEIHEQTGNAFDRLRRISLVLRESDRLRNFTLQQWQQLGRRSLFDVIAAESEHYNLRVQYVNALHDGQQMNAMLLSMGSGLRNWLP